MPGGWISTTEVGFLVLIKLKFLRANEAFEHVARLTLRNVAALLNDGDREMPRDDLKAMLRYGDAAAVAARPTAR